MIIIIDGSEWFRMALCEFWVVPGDSGLSRWFRVVQGGRRQVSRSALSGGCKLSIFHEE